MGPGEDMCLTKDPGEIKVGRYNQEASKSTRISLLVFAIPQRTVSPCERKDQCVTRSVWEKAAQQITEYFNSVTIADLCEEARRKNINTSGKAFNLHTVYNLAEYINPGAA